MLECIAVGVGGFIGSICRYLIGLIPLKEGYVFPVKTFVINLCGSFLIGMIAALAAKHDSLSPKLILFLKAGLSDSLSHRLADSLVQRAKRNVLKETYQKKRRKRTGKSSRPFPPDRGYPEKMQSAVRFTSQYLFLIPLRYVFFSFLPFPVWPRLLQRPAWDGCHG